MDSSTKRALKLRCRVEVLRIAAGLMQAQGQGLQRNCIFVEGGLSRYHLGCGALPWVGGLQQRGGVVEL